MSRPLSPVFSSLCLAALCILLTGSFPACSKHSEQKSQDSGDPASNTGGVSFGLIWQKPSSSGAKAAKRAPSFNACIDYAIDTITATVSSATTTVTSSSWPCSAHEGLILSVPAGTNYTVRVDGISSGLTTWSGLTSAIGVISGQITNAGTIAMGYAGGDTARPTVTSIAPHSNPAITTNVPVTDRIIIAFSEPMAISTVNAANIVFKLTDNSPVPGNVSYDAASNTAAFIPSATLEYDRQYVLQVISGLTDVAGNQLASDSTNTFTTEAQPQGVPNAPSAVTATPGNGQVRLDWSAANGATSYNVYYLSSSGVTTTNNTASFSNALAPFVHLGLANAQTYCYIVTAVNSFGESLASAEVNATPNFPAGNPSPPASLTVTPGIGQNTIAWPPVAGATSYNLYWSTTSITPDKTTADNVIRDVVSPYSHTGLTSGVTYCYLITAMDSNGESTDSMQVCEGGVGALHFSW